MLGTREGRVAVAVASSLKEEVGRTGEGRRWAACRQSASARSMGSVSWFVPVWQRVHVSATRPGRTGLCCTQRGSKGRQGAVPVAERRCPQAPVRTPDALAGSRLPGSGWRWHRVALDYPQPLSLNFSPYITFLPIFPPIFSSTATVSPKYSHIPHYNYKISFSISTINFLSTNNYSSIYNTVFRVMNSDTLDLGEKEGGRRVGGAVGAPLRPWGAPYRRHARGGG
jgi:hypothetical protein